MTRKKLSRDEIDQALQKIRSCYDNFIVSYLKPLTIKDEFEYRYLESLRQRRDPAAFFQEELLFLKSMEEKEKLKQEEALRKDYVAAQKAARRRKEASLAERVMAENRRMIEKYPSIAAENKDIGFEVQKLFGALSVFEKELWPEIEQVLRQFHGRSYKPYSYLEHRLYDLMRKSVDDLPGGMSRYMTVLERVPRNINKVDIEHKRCLIDVAGFLHDVKAEIDILLDRGRPDMEELEQLEYLRDRTVNIIKDFRMQDLKPNMMRRR